MWCLVYYGILALYFFGVRLLLGEAVALGAWGYVLAFMLFALTGVLAMRVDLLWLSYGTHMKMFERYNKPPIRGKGQFFFGVLSYYAFLAGAAIGFFLLQDKVHFLVFYYLVFLAASVAMVHFDYLFPSYERYSRNVQAGQWGLARLSRA